MLFDPAWWWCFFVKREIGSWLVLVETRELDSERRVVVLVGFGYRE